VTVGLESLMVFVDKHPKAKKAFDELVKLTAGPCDEAINESSTNWMDDLLAAHPPQKSPRTAPKAPPTPASPVATPPNSA
jgi:hypothetical protein